MNLAMAVLLTVPQITDVVIAMQVVYGVNYSVQTLKLYTSYNDYAHTFY